jgi:methylation protein EvaC
MNFCRIDDRLIRYTVDKSPRKVGLYTPGAHLQVRPVSALYAPETRPDYVVVLAWNIGEEIMKQERAFRDTGGRFIIPIPQPQVI